MPNLIFNRRLNQSKSSYNVIVENWLNELRVLGYTLPSEAYIIKLNNYVNSDISNLTLMVGRGIRWSSLLKKGTSN